MIFGVWHVGTLGRDLTHPAKKRGYGKAVDEDGEGDGGKADSNNFFSPREFRGKSEGKCQRQCAPQPSPEQDMLMFHRDAKR